MNLRTALATWTDQDIAAYQLGIVLGLIDPKYSFSTDTKWVFWTDNPVGNALGEMLDAMVTAGILEKEEEDLRYRWNPVFKGGWEKP